MLNVVVVACRWRIRVALRYEQQALRKEFVKEHEGISEELKGAGFAFPCGLSVRKNEQAIKLIGALRLKRPGLWLLSSKRKSVRPLARTFGKY